MTREGQELSCAINGIEYQKVLVLISLVASRKLERENKWAYLNLTKPNLAKPYLDLTKRT